MVSDVRNFFHVSLYRRLASVAMASVCILCSIPQSGICLAPGGTEPRESIDGILNHIIDSDSGLIVEKFDALEETIQSSANPLDESRKFLQSFINEINAKYQLALTVPEACRLIRENLHVLQIPQEAQPLLLATIELFESDSAQHPPSEQKQDLNQMTNFNGYSLSLSWPWEWNWFGLNKKQHKHRHERQDVASPTLHIASPGISGTEIELPGSIYSGSVEIFAGALVCILGSVFPPAYGLGVALVVDGTRRILNGAEEQEKERRGDLNGQLGAIPVLQGRVERAICSSAARDLPPLTGAENLLPSRKEFFNHTSSGSSPSGINF